MTFASVARSGTLLPPAWKLLAPLCCAAALAGCGTAPKPGGYYQNDGPPERPPAELDDAADAVPRVEPLHPRANRPYTALGRSYTPLTADVPFQQRGTASWYGKQFHGNRTASGEIYDMYAMTAAHPTLPIPSYVRVTNPRNGRSVIVRVNDRGPFKDGRVIDLSYGAATRLGLVTQGVGEVEVERLTFTQIAAGDWTRGAGAGPREATTATAAADRPAAPAGPAAAASGSARWSVQVGAFAQQTAAEDLAARIAAVLGFTDNDLAENQRDTRIERDGSLFRVLVGVVPDRPSATALAQQLERLLGRPAIPLPR